MHWLFLFLIILIKKKSKIKRNNFFLILYSTYDITYLVTQTRPLYIIFASFSSLFSMLNLSSILSLSLASLNTPIITSIQSLNCIHNSVVIFTLSRLQMILQMPD